MQNPPPPPPPTLRDDLAGQGPKRAKKSPEKEGASGCRVGMRALILAVLNRDSFCLLGGGGTAIPIQDW